MELKLQIDANTIINEAKKTFENKIRETINEQQRLALKPSNPSWKDKGGYLFEMIQEQIDTQFTKESTQKFADDYIAKHWDDIYRIALDEAMRLRADHLARQQIFGDAGLKNPREAISKKTKDSLNGAYEDFDSDHIQNGA